MGFWDFLSGGSNKEQTQTQTPSAEGGQLNQLLLQNLMGVMGQTGGSQGFLGNNLGLYGPSNLGMGELSNLQRLGQSTGTDQNWLNQVYQNALGRAPDPLASGWLSQGLGAQDIIQRIMSSTEGAQRGPSAGSEQSILQRIIQMSQNPLTVNGQDPQALMGQGLNTLQGLADPAQTEAAYGRYFNSIVAPQIRNNASAQGTGGSGAVSESMANYMAQLAPVMDQSRIQGGTNYANALSGAAAFLPGLQQSQMGLVGMGLGPAGAGRQGALQNYNANSSLANTILSGIPFSSGGTTTGQGSQSGNLNNLLQGIGSLAGGIGGLMDVWKA